MVKLLKLLLTYTFKTSQPTQKNRGFTLIEVLVGLILAFLVILPLLGFMVNLLQTDRQEQAKATSEQEMQAALDYIARDVEQAVYIYDGYGISQIQTQLPQPTNSVPVLVFWKRQLVREAIPTRNGQDDAFVYALVAYYLRRDPNCAQPTSPWSCTAQITRVQVRDAVRNPEGNPIGGGSQNNASPGFTLFNPNIAGAASVEAIMNQWISGGGINNNTPEVLIDYIDQTPQTTFPACPAPTRSNPPPEPGYNGQIASLTPNQTTLAASGFNPPVSGFYACVDVEKTSAIISMRGNAMARLRRKSAPPSYVANQNIDAYFPSANIQVKGRGLYSKQVE